MRKGSYLKTGVIEGLVSFAYPRGEVEPTELSVAEEVSLLINKLRFEFSLREVHEFNNPLCLK